MLAYSPFIAPEVFNSRIMILIRQQMAPKLKLRYTINPKFVYDCLNLHIKERNTNDADEMRKVQGGTFELIAVAVVVLLLLVFEFELEEMQDNKVGLYLKSVGHEEIQDEEFELTIFRQFGLQVPQKVIFQQVLQLVMLQIKQVEFIEQGASAGQERQQKF